MNRPPPTITAAFTAPGDNDVTYPAEHEQPGSAAGFHDEPQERMDPTGTTTHTPESAAVRHLDPEHPAAITIQDAATAGVPLAGTRGTPGQ